MIWGNLWQLCSCPVQEAFQHEANLNVWKVCGVVPLTRLAMQSSKVRHKVPVMTALEHQEGLSTSLDLPAIKKLKQLDHKNKLFYELCLPMVTMVQNFASRPLKGKQW
jgi:hypothetical protein